jgi:hypothetical protein
MRRRGEELEADMGFDGTGVTGRESLGWMDRVGHIEAFQHERRRLREPPGP